MTLTNADVITNKTLRLLVADFKSLCEAEKATEEEREARIIDFFLGATQALRNVKHDDAEAVGAFALLAFDFGYQLVDPFLGMPSADEIKLMIKRARH